MGLRLAILVLTTIVWLATGCGDDATPGMDSGPGRDGGTGDRDAGPGIDTGVARDTGTGADAGPGTDAGPSRCTPACATARDCCGGECTNLQNDPRNCGRCGVTCGAGTYCTDGTCTTIPCMGSCSPGETCCGNGCCRSGMICCDPQGPISRGPSCVMPDDRGTCPQGCAPMCDCASPDTPVATPDGERPIASLRVGDLVYSVEDDAVVMVPVVRTRQNPVEGHRVVRVTLDTGTALSISGSHPTADGRAFEQLRAGDRLDGVPIRSVEVVPYAHRHTYDILAGSTSGAYYAGGVLIGSTIR